MQTHDTDILKMSNEGVDAYMDWYQRTWATTTSRGEEPVGVRKELLALFPTKELEEVDRVALAQRREEKVKALRQQRLSKVLGEGGLKAREVRTEEQVEELDQQRPGYAARILRPGMRYQAFRKVEELSGAAKAFYEEAAEVACVDLTGLVRAVVKAEGMVEKWRLERRRERAFADQEVAADEIEVDVDEEARAIDRDVLDEDVVDDSPPLQPSIEVDGP
jgi:hypothetical protein